MRARMIKSLLMVSTLVAVPAAAQNPTWGSTGKWNMTVGGGVTFPVGAIGDSQKTGWNARVTAGYRPKDSRHTWSFEAGFAQHEQITNPDDSLGKVHAGVMNFMARYDLDLSPGLYVTGGIGMLRNEYKVRFSNVVLTNTDSHVGLAAGAGFNIARRIFAEGRIFYSMSKPDASIWVPVTIGLRF